MNSMNSKKKSAAKSLGVAVLGAAFAAAGAGAANAAPAVPDATQALNGVTGTLPAQNVARTVPGAADALAGRVHPGDAGARRERAGDVPPARRPDRLHRAGRDPDRRAGRDLGRRRGASDDVPLSGSFRLTGPVRPVGADRVLTTPVSVRALSTEAT